MKEQEIGIRDYVGLLVEGRRTILSTLAVAIAVTVVYLILVPVTYKADALLRIDKNKPMSASSLQGESRSLAETQNSRARREVEILRSRSVLGKVVEDLNLMIEVSPVYFPIIGETLARHNGKHGGMSGAWWGFGRWAWGGERLKIGRFDLPDRYLEKTFSLVALEDGRFRLLGPKGRILIEGRVGEAISADIGKHGPVTIKLDALAARPGTRFELVRKTSLSAIDTLQKAFSVRDVSNDTDILRVELIGKEPEQLAQTVNDIAKIYVDATTHWESADVEQKLGFLEGQLFQAKENTKKAGQALKAYKQKHGEVDISAEAETLLKQATEMEILSAKLTQKREDQSKRLENTHPDMIATNAQIELVDKKLAVLEKSIEGLPNVQRNTVNLSKDVRVNTELYTLLSNGIQEQRISAARALGNARIAEFAAVPEKPDWPKPGLLLAVAALFGVGLGSAIVFFRHSLQRHDNYLALLEYQVGFPLFAAIQQGKVQRRTDCRFGPGRRERENSMSLIRESADVSVDSLRVLRTTLEVALDGDESNVIMISSPIPGMEESFICTNLAALLAGARKRVLIVDADMRSGYLHETFSVGKQPGFSDLLAGNAGLGDVIVSLPDIGIDLIPRGEMVSNPGELLLFGELGGILEQLKSFYNHIVIDSPPVLGSADTAIIGKYCDTTFLAVKEGRYTAQELEVSFRRLQQAGVSPKGFIINDMKEGASYYPYYGYAYQQRDEQRKESSSWQMRFQQLNDWIAIQETEYLLDMNQRKSLEDSLRA